MYSTQAHARVPDFYKNVIVMRHGDRIDNVGPLRASTAARPWDPPLFREGWVQALETGRGLRMCLGFPIHRLFVSPFLCCVQTASKVVTALCAVYDDPNALTRDAIPIDPSKLPQWDEPVLSTRARYEQIFKDIADKYRTENMLLVTHGEGVRVALSAFIKDAEVHEVEFYVYVELRRPIFQKDQSFTAGEFKVLTQTGISYFLPNALTSDINET